MTSSARNALWIIGLALLMLVTRGELLSSIVPVQLHDASWAAFLLAGAVLRKPVYLLALAGLAFGLDYASLCAGSFALGSCLKPSYPALMASWGLLWAAGRLLTTGQLSGAAIGKNLLMVAGAATGAYLLTSGAFYLWSGLYDGWTLGQYTTMSSAYFLMALGTTVGYTAAGLFIRALQSGASLSGTRQTA
ncbi:MAG: hypothetical protein AB8B96_18420 [Lysobacterales bacterium]